jgi:hypothetical protein
MFGGKHTYTPSEHACETRHIYLWPHYLISRPASTNKEKGAKTTQLNQKFGHSEEKVRAN